LNLAQDNQEALQLFCLSNAGKFYLFRHISFERQGTNASCFSSFTLSFDEGRGKSWKFLSKTRKTCL